MSRFSGHSRAVLATLLSVVACQALALEEPAVPAGVSSPAPKLRAKDAPPARVTIVAGPLASMGGGAPAGLQPFFNVGVDFPMARPLLAPRMDFTLELGSLPGESISEGDPTTWRTANVAAGLSQRFAPALNFAARCEVGFTNRMPGDLEPLERSARWWSCGLLFDSDVGRLYLGGGMDERLGGGYAPTAHATGRLRLKHWQEGTLKSAAVYLYGRAILGLRILWVIAEERTDVLLLGLGGGFGGK